MSDADNQTGGTGGETGPEPEDVSPGRDNAAPSEAPEKEGGTESGTETEESFPASDPPANY